MFIRGKVSFVFIAVVSVVISAFANISATSAPVIATVAAASAPSLLDSLPTLTTGERAGHSSSFDRTGGNDDSSGGLYTDSHGDRVILDVSGPGTVDRMWFTGIDESKIVHIYFDGESTPRVSMTLGDMFRAGRAPFTAPLVATPESSSGAYTSYVPLPFARSVVVTLTDYGLGYFNIDYHRSAPGTAITSWTGAEDLSAMRALWSAGGAQVPASGTTATANVAVPANSTATLYDAAGPAQVSRLTLQVSQPAGATADLLATLRLQMFWDGEATPSVDAPLGSLFSVGTFGASVVNAVAAGRTADGTLYLNFPMPFARHATFRVVNTAGSSATVASAVTSAPYAGSFADVGYFRTQYRETTAQTGHDIVLLDANGAGKLVGVVESITGTSDNWFLEGDERGLPDGTRTPTIHGTGTEDFFNGGWYFNHGPYTGPTSGNTAHFTDAAGGHVSAYRHMLADPVPFDSHLHFSIEHSAVDEDGAQVTSLAYYYSQPQPRMRQTDLVAVTGATSVADHNYAVTGQVARYPLSSTFEGENGNNVVSGGVRAINGVSTFTIAVDPANAGVLLRRTFDQQASHQAAAVSVNGVYVTDWNSPGGNGTHRWREEDLVLPATVTAGHSTLQISVDSTHSPSPWTESAYGVFSLYSSPVVAHASVPVSVTPSPASVGVGAMTALSVSAAVPDGTTVGCYDGADLAETATVRGGTTTCYDGSLRAGVHPLIAALLSTPTTDSAVSSPGVVDVVGADPVRDRFISAGGIGGLGLPTTPPYPVAGGVGQSFERGEIMWSPSTGAHIIIGEIRASFDDLGGPGPRFARNPIGFPTTDEVDVPGGRASFFTGAGIYWSPATGAHDVGGAIYDRYLAFGGPGGVLGLPVAGEHGLAATRFNEFTNGGIYWTGATGAHVVQGRIHDAYLANGSWYGILGTPLTDELTTPDRIGRYNHFANGSIYWTPATGAHEVYGTIRAKWSAAGWERSFYGYPVTGEYAVANGRASNFQGANIYWGPTTGAFEVHGSILANYLAMGGPSSILGLPVTDETTTPDRIGRFNHFVGGGSIYWTPATGAHEVYGAIRAKWSALGWELGLPGYPVTGEYAVANGRASNFQHANIYWGPTTGAFEVHGAILATYAALGGPSSRYGLPTSDEYAIPGGRASNFVGGRLVWTPAGGVVLQ